MVNSQALDGKCRAHQAAFAGIDASAPQPILAADYLEAAFGLIPAALVLWAVLKRRRQERHAAKGGRHEV